MQFILNNIGLVVIIFFAVAPAIGRAIAKVNEQAKIKKLRDEQERARLEALRTGRPVSQQTQPPQASGTRPQTQARPQVRAAPPPPQLGGGLQPPPNAPTSPDPTEAARARLQELARRRQAQIDRLKQQRAQSASSPSTRATQGGSQGQNAFQPSQRPAPQGRPQPIPQQTPQRAQARRQQPLPQRAIPQRPIPMPAPVTDAPGQTPRRRRDKPKSPLLSSSIGSPPTQSRQPAPPQKDPLRGLSGMSRDELRRAIVMSEVLAPPVSLRQDDSGA